MSLSLLNLPVLKQRFLETFTESLRNKPWDCITDLAVHGDNIFVERFYHEMIGKTLRAHKIPNGNKPSTVWMQDLRLLCTWLDIRDDGPEPFVLWWRWDG
jgi:hypothetical protein